MLRHARARIPSARRATTLLLVAGLLLPAAARAADPVATATQTFWATNGTVDAIVPSGTGSVFLGGAFDYVGPITGGGAGLHTSTAALTLSKRVNGTVRAAVSDGFGGIYIGGDFTQVDGLTRQGLAHIQSNNTVSSWGPAVNGSVLALATNGVAVWVGGSFTSVGGLPRQNLAQVLTADGSVTTFQADTNAAVRALGIFTSTLVVGGDYSAIGGSPRQGLSVVGANSAAVLHPVANVVKGPPGSETTGSVRAFAIIGTTIYMGGDFSGIRDLLGNRTDRQNLASFDGGALTLYLWNPGADATVESVATDGSTIWAGGAFTTTQGVSRKHVAAYTATSSTASPLLAGWSADVSRTSGTPAVTAITADTGGRVYIGGLFSHVKHTDGTLAERVNLAAVAASNGGVVAWEPRAGGQVRTIAPTGSSVYVGGQFTSVGGFRRDNLAELSLSTGQLTSWKPSANAPVRDIVVRGGTLYAGGQFTTIDGVARSRFAAVSTTTGELASWRADADATVHALTVTPSGVVLGGAFTTVSDGTTVHPRSGLALLSHAGAVQSWAPAATGGSVFALAPSPYLEDVLVGGSFTSLGGAARNGLGSVAAGTGVVRAWAPATNGTVRTVVATTQSVYAGGTFTSAGGESRQNLVALDPTTGLARTAFTANANGTVEDLAVAPNGVFATGAFTTIAGQSRQGLAKLDGTSGTPTPWAPTFGTTGGHAVAAIGESVYAGAAVVAPDTNDRGVFAYPATAATAPYLACLDATSTPNCLEVRVPAGFAFGPLHAGTDTTGSEQVLELIATTARGVQARTDRADGRLREWTGTAYGTASLAEPVRATGRLLPSGTPSALTPLSSVAAGLVPSVPASDCTDIPQLCVPRQVGVSFKQQVRYSDQQLNGRSYRAEVTYDVVAPF